jgi:hypothetical protein
MGKARYGCTNHKKGFPIDELGGVCCSNQKTILRSNLEERVLTCLPAAFFGLGVFDKISKQAKKDVAATVRDEAPGALEQFKAELANADAQQKLIIRQISDRLAQGRPSLAAFDDELDTLEETRQSLIKMIAEADTPEVEDTVSKILRLQQQINPEAVEIVLNTILYAVREHADKETRQPFINLVRQFIQKVVIGKTPGHQPASLEVHGRIASILGAMEASDILEKRFLAGKHNEFLAKGDAGELRSERKQKEFLDACAEELSVRRQQWRNIQVSVVAGAGFEPAAFRL